jgi:GNAT superfamily N-acetyltransferase
VSGLGVDLRPIRTGEAEAAYLLELRCYKPEAAATLEAIRHRTRQYAGYFWSAWRGDTLVGFANGVLTDAKDTGEESMKGSGHESPSGRHLCVLSVAVDPKARRQGIGSLLMRQLLEAARRQRLRSVFLMCEAHLIPMYESLGFAYAGISPSRHADIEWHEMRCEMEGWQA